jgi:hypothetical protein
MVYNIAYSIIYPLSSLELTGTVPCRSTTEFLLSNRRHQLKTSVVGSGLGMLKKLCENLHNR